MVFGVFMPAPATGLPVEASFLGGQVLTTGSTSMTFSSVTVSEPGLLVVLAARYRTAGGNGSINSFDIDGSTVANLLPAQSLYQTVGSAAKRIMAPKSVPITVNMSNAPTGAAIGVWLLKNVLSDEPFSTGFNMDNSSSHSDSFAVDVPSGGFVVLGHVHWGTGSTTWSAGVTERYSAAGGSSVRFSMADYAGQDAEPGKTFQASFSFENSATAGLAWR